MASVYTYTDDQGRWEWQAEVLGHGKIRLLGGPAGTEGLALTLYLLPTEALAISEALATAAREYRLKREQAGLE